MHAKHGPWSDYGLVMRLWYHDRVKSIDGRKPVAVERKQNLARLLFEKPADEREPFRVFFGMPEYVAID
jgi:hypothetical protein